MSSVVTVDEDRLKELAHQMAVITTALHLIPDSQFKAIADIDKEDLIEFGTDIATELLRLRADARPANRKDYRH